MTLRKHWPVVFALLAVVVSIILAVFAYRSTDAGYAIFTSVITFMFLFPLAGALIGAWYGWRLRSWKKWLIPPAVYGCVVLYMVLAGLILRKYGRIVVGAIELLSLFGGLVVAGAAV